MGRQKANKPRRQRVEAPNTVIAESDQHAIDVMTEFLMRTDMQESDEGARRGKRYFRTAIVCDDRVRTLESWCDTVEEVIAYCAQYALPPTDVVRPYLAEPTQVVAEQGFYRYDIYSVDNPSREMSPLTSDLTLYIRDVEAFRNSKSAPAA